MKIQITQKKISAFTVSGITVRTRNQDEADPSKAKLSAHWGNFFSSGIAEKIPHRLQDSPVYGMYSNYESDFNGHYDVTAGVAVSAPSDEFKTITVPEGTYMVFESKGAMPQVVIEVWTKIWQFFQENPHIKRKYITDFETYLGNEEISVAIGIEDNQ